jgi:acetyl esterase/lipase
MDLEGWREISLRFGLPSRGFFPGDSFPLPQPPEGMKPHASATSRPTVSRPAFCYGGACLAVLTLLGSAVPRAAGPKAVCSSGPATYAVREVKNVPYWTGRDADPARHKLDLYLPRTDKPFPVIVFVHGGAWVLGDKGFFGWGGDIGRCFARLGIGAVLPSYRLSPGVKHPGHVKDVARAFAWTSKHIAQYGGRPDQLFLCGHSAGGHLVSLLASDEVYLKEVGLDASAIKGVISVSGVYRIPQFDHALTAAPSPGKSSFDLTSVLQQFDLPITPFSSVFGNDARVLRDASPLSHVHAGLPPFLLIYAGGDLPLLPDMAREFARGLKDARCDVHLLQVKDRDHETVMFDATTADDPVTRAIRGFVEGHLGKGMHGSTRQKLNQ